MAGISVHPSIGLELIGKYGRYRVKRRIGSGGNGSVYEADVIEACIEIQQAKTYAIKFLTVNLDDDTELEKRKARFVKEIKQVLVIQGDSDVIIPVYDSSILVENEQEYLWYLMPMAEAYSPRKYDTLQKLTHMLQLSDCIRKLHNLGYAHRDIKPKNLLIYNGALCLSDFGLVWNINDNDEHITEVNDRLGPQAIRPPELQPVEKLDSIDYRKSDVYLFAKTVWMVLKCNNSGFAAQYSRMNNSIYIDKLELNIETAEPLHRMMTEATKDNYWERCRIEDCLRHLEDQVNVIEGRIPQKLLMQWKYEEQVKRNRDIIPADDIIYREPSAIMRILNGLSETVGLVFSTVGKEYDFLPLKKANYVRDEIYQIEIANPYAGGRKKVIELSIEKIIFAKDMSYKIISKSFIADADGITTFTQILKALESPHKRVRLNAAYLIKMHIL